MGCSRCSIYSHVFPAVPLCPHLPIPVHNMFRRAPLPISNIELSSHWRGVLRRTSRASTSAWSTGQQTLHVRRHVVACSVTFVSTEKRRLTTRWKAIIITGRPTTASFARSGRVTLAALLLSKQQIVLVCIMFVYVYVCKCGYVVRCANNLVVK